MSIPIPQPPGIAFLGNVGDLDKEFPLRGFRLLAQKYGDVYQLNLVGRVVIVANSYALVNELSDETRFRKTVKGSLAQVRNLVGDGLFTATPDEPNWAIAHRLLMPAFGTAAIRDMLEDMRDVSDQLLLKWERFGPEAIIEPTEDFTKVALDTVALCTMSYRLNSLYTVESAPFAKAMFAFLKECFPRANRPSVVQLMMRSTNAKYKKDMKFMRDLAEQVLSSRRAHPTDKNDLLNKMINGKDPKTGQGLSDENIINNLLTFLIAGHETSSATLSFITYYLLKNPDAMRKLRAEVDDVIGDYPAQYEDLCKMRYLHAVIRETLRLQTPAPLRTVSPIEDTTICGGKHSIKADVTIWVQNGIAHRDSQVYGEDVNEFHPERMIEEKFKALPPNAWQPFGNGMRACIGRPFAWQEIQLVLASIIQKFDLSLVDPSYNLEHKQALTIKPKNFFIRASPRVAKPRLYKRPSVQPPAEAKKHIGVPPTEIDADKWPLYVLYGSNTGTSESFAQRIANAAPSYGFRPNLWTLDSVVENFPNDGPAIVVTASFEGQPADNAGHFVNWLESLEGNEFTGVRFGVFGCGNRDWVQTYQRIPELCDKLLEQRGGNRLLPRGVGDASEGNFFQVFEEFESNLWKVLCKEYQTSRSDSSVSVLQMETVDPGRERATTLRQTDAALGRVIENRLLTKPGAPMKRHIEFELPEGMSSQTGNYLAILPHNPPRDVHRVLSRLSLAGEQQIVLSSLAPLTLPIGKVVTISSLLSGYVELCQPATIRDIDTLMGLAGSVFTRASLEKLSTTYQEKVFTKRLSVLDILEKYSDIQVSLTTLLQMLPAMRVRQYSISSSPLWNPQHVTLTISVIGGPSIAGSEEPFLGVASNYLAGLRPGDRVQIATRPSAIAFHPPVDPTVPIVMFCAGSGLAPMRGFIQERAVQKQSGREICKMLLFFGCRSPDEDYLYFDSDLGEWTKAGVVDVRPAFSRASEKSENCAYVQDRIWHDREDIRKAYHSDAKFFTCGSGKVASGVKAMLTEIVREGMKDGPVNEDEVQAKFEKLTKGRYVTDIFD